MTSPLPTFTPVETSKVLLYTLIVMGDISCPTIPLETPVIWTLGTIPEEENDPEKTADELVD
jgi:hypothetical protein